MDADYVKEDARDNRKGRWGSNYNGDIEKHVHQSLVGQRQLLKRFRQGVTGEITS